METKAPHPGDFLKDKSANNLIRAWFEVNQLKQLYRQGWLSRGVPKQRCESVADHSFGVALLAMWIAESSFPHLDPLKVLRLALLHDLGEAHAGDLTPSHQISKEEKTRLEEEGFQKIVSGLSGSEKWLELWREYEHQTTEEARFIKSIDRLEMAMQAAVYEYQENQNLEEFFQSAQEYLKEGSLGDLYQDLQSVRTRTGG